jgi:hypothetical protein
MTYLVRLEEFGFFLFSIYLFASLPFRWWYFPLLLFAPDLSIAGYLAGPRVGAIIYNIVRHRAFDLLLYVLGLMLGMPILCLVGVVMFAHSSLDRALGYGLKFSDSFTNTHLGRIGRNATEG